jgi:tripartite-type tricarboxylate transporter receptor subunit TctC
MAAGGNAQQPFPSQPLKLIVALGAGGVGDTTARLVAEKMGDKLGQRVVVENMPGGGGIAAARAALQPAADGHTMILLTNGTAIAAALFKSLQYDPIKDFAPVSKLGQFEFFFATRGDGPFQTLADFVKAAKAAPGKLNVGTINPGSTQHLTALLLKSSAGIDFQWVPFKTTPDLLIGLIRGDIDMTVEAYSALKGNVLDGKIRALAATSAKRSPSVPNLPAAPEAGAGDMDVVSWNGLFVRAGAPVSVILQLNKAVREALADEGLKKKLLDIGIAGEASSPEQIGGLLKADIARWAKVIGDNKIERR